MKVYFAQHSKDPMFTNPEAIQVMPSEEICKAKFTWTVGKEHKSTETYFGFEDKLNRQSGTGERFRLLSAEEIKNIFLSQLKEAIIRIGLADTTKLIVVVDCSKFCFFPSTVNGIEKI